MTLSSTEILALAPDASSAKSAQGLVKPAQWPTLAHDEKAVWGLCQGSGSKPYQTQVDLSNLAFKCSCPSRKFPCKHGLALLLLRDKHPQEFKTDNQPSWVSDWLNNRAEKAQKAQVKAESVDKDPKIDLAAQVKRQNNRWKKIEQASAELEKLLQDCISTGLSNSAMYGFFKTMAQKMVDAQAPGIADRIHLLIEHFNTTPSPSRNQNLLSQLGQLQLFCDAIAKRPELPVHLQQQLRTVCAWPLDKAEVLEKNQAFQDQFWVLGISHQSIDKKLTERRVWLWAEKTNQRVLLQDFSYAGQAFEHNWLLGTRHHLEMVIYPDGIGLRGLVKQILPASSSESTQDSIFTQLSQAAVSKDWASEKKWQAALYANALWLETSPMLLHQVQIVHRKSLSASSPSNQSIVAIVDQQIIELAINDIHQWHLLTFALNQKIILFGEWNQHQLTPLLAIGSNSTWQPQPLASTH